MSSGQGSVANNTNGQHEVYRSSKAALNTLTQLCGALCQRCTKLVAVGARLGENRDRRSRRLLDD